MRALVAGIFAASLTISGITAAEVASSHQTLTTQRRVQGTITAVEGTTLTIAPHGAQGITGKIDPKRTAISMNGRPARMQDLHPGAAAKGEMGLDDVWVSIQAESH
jgi:hypothetical protein